MCDRDVGGVVGRGVKGLLESELGSATVEMMWLSSVAWACGWCRWPCETGEGWVCECLWVDV